MRVRTIPLAMLLLSLVVVWGIYSRYGERYSLFHDAKDAANDIRAIESAERLCYKHKGQYLSLDRLDGDNRCGLILQATRKAAAHGLRVQIKGDSSSYSILLIPSSPKRVVSLYVDQGGIIHLGTKRAPASPNTVVYHDRR